MTHPNVGDLSGPVTRAADQPWSGSRYQDERPMIVDAHVHVACPDVICYPRRPSGLGSEWWKTSGGADQLRQTLDDNSVARAVVVHAGGLYGYDCRCAIDVVAADPSRLALVAGIDMDGPEPVANLLALAGAGATGVRVSGLGAEVPRWLGDGRGASLWAAAAQANVVVVPNLLPENLGSLAALCAAVPSAAVVLDHCGFVHFGSRVGNDEALLCLADLPGVHLKVTTNNLVGADSADWLGRLVASFGAARLCWGSDYPQLQELSYAEMCRVAELAASTLSDQDRQAFFASTSLQLWWR